MKIILIALFCFAKSASFASGLSQGNLQDSIIPQSEYKLDENGFLEKYGNDDSSKALIHFYFGRRLSAKILFFTNVWQIPLCHFQSLTISAHSIPEIPAISFLPD